MSVRRPTTGESFVFVWVLGFLALSAGSAVLFEWNVFMLPLIYGLWALLGVGLLLALLLGHDWRAAGLLAVLAAFALVLSPIADSLGARLWFRVSFDRHAEAYRSIVARAGALPENGAVNGVTYEMERGPPIRIAFPQPVGVADNWAAVIHDPSDAVATATRSRAGPGSAFQPDLTKLFGGDLVSCQRITGHYYRCDFS